MTPWKRGKQALFERLDETALPLDIFLGSIRIQPPHRVSGTAVFLSARPDAVPHALLHNLLHNQVLHEQVVMLTGLTEDTPRVDPKHRSEVTDYGNGFYRVLLHFGFMDEPDVPAALKLCQGGGLDFAPMRTTYFLSRETVIPTKRFGMAIWREGLFAFLQKNANSSMSYFQLPVNRVIELGAQVEI
ncbi:KUP/HAK/KT family potassium transporter [Metapseudomonas boanensis]|uniref:KUP/HAK/KT family potassium transporter n=1 Tax=Metapseudomonas boanensis TaxID=2822138 RepID=UPI003741FAD4